MYLLKRCFFEKVFGKSEEVLLSRGKDKGRIVYMNVHRGVITLSIIIFMKKLSIFINQRL